MLDELAERLRFGLTRKSINRCSMWAERYRVMGKPVVGPWTFHYHPWLKAMCDDKSEYIVGQKAAQMGFTEVALNRTFYAMDILKESVLYVLPAETPDAKDFSASRFDPAVELSEHIGGMFSDTKNIGHKRAGSCSLYVRGSRSRSQLKSIPVSHIVLDELAEMDQDNISLAFERTSGQFNKSIFMISTPTIDDKDINTYYKDSDRKHFFFHCPSCSQLIELTLDNLVITAETFNDTRIRDSHLICLHCRNILPHLAKPDYLAQGLWVPELHNVTWSGWHIPQLYSSTIEPYQLAQAVLRAKLDPSAEQELYNSKLGLPHIVKGANISDDNIKNCTKTFQQGPQKGLICMGVDVGKQLHVEISRFIPGEPSTCRVIHHCTVLEFNELDKLMIEYRVHHCVIDANPETREATKFANRFIGRVHLCYYAKMTGLSIKLNEQDLNPVVTVSRTCWLDASLGRFKLETISIPPDTQQEYKDHIQALVRIYEKDMDGNPVGRYVCKDNRNDHYAHARNYCEIAYAIVAMALGTRGMEAPV